MKLAVQSLLSLLEGRKTWIKPPFLWKVIHLLTEKNPRQVFVLSANSSLQAFCSGKSGSCFPTGLIYGSEDCYPRKLLQWPLESHVENWSMVLSCQENGFLKVLNTGWIFSPWDHISQVILFLDQWRSGYLRPLMTLHLLPISVLFSSPRVFCPSLDHLLHKKKFLALWRCIEAA